MNLLLEFLMILTFPVFFLIFKIRYVNIYFNYMVVDDNLSEDKIQLKRHLGKRQFVSLTTMFVIPYFIIFIASFIL